VAILGWEYSKARIADSRLPALVAQCKGSRAIHPGPIPIPPGATIGPAIGSPAPSLPVPSASDRIGHAVPPSDVITGPPGSVPIPPGAFVDSATIGEQLAASMVGVCEPYALAYTGSVGYALTPVQQKIADYAQDAQARTAWPFAIAVFAVFWLPLIWYFLLDRIRELGAAISGRDRTQ
jgi:hypothetical protein